MFKHSFRAYILSIASLISCGYTFTHETAQSTSMPDHVAHQYVNGIFEKPKIAPIQETAEPTGIWAQWEKFKKTIEPKTTILTDRETQEMAFDIAATNNFKTTIIDNSLVDKLEIVHGGENSNNSLFQSIFKNRISTAIGKAHATLTFCHPVTDASTLKNRAQAIQLLSANNSYTLALHTLLQQIAAIEKQSLIFWHSKPVANQDLLKAAYFGSMLQGLNTNTVALEGLGRSLLLLQGTINFCFIPGEITYMTYAMSQVSHMSFKDTATKLLSLIKATTSVSQQIGIVSGLCAVQALIAYPFYCQFQSTKAIYLHVQKIMIATASHINALRKLSSLISKNKELLHNVPSLQPLADFNNPTKRSAKLNKLLGMLGTDTFVGEPSFWSVTGRVLAAYELMKQVKDELAPVFAAAGELDMYVALAQLYNSRENAQARYCMVNFVENSATPVIKAHNFWNPFINPDTVVTNSITFDHLCPNSILTGPNTGGKSTVIKGIMINVLMAQTFGIAPSESLTITPFTKLNCFMNISDDIATGASLFKSEVMRAKKLLEMVQSLAQNEFSFVIIDEVFTGTSPKEGEMAALRFAEHLGTYSNNTSIIATHYPKMVDLETNNSNNHFRNHHVEILRNDDDSLNRTFKLKDGASFFNVAFDILEEEGLFV